ncbi:MAG: hypothetical protein QXP59_01215 [Saccharolobus sp.]
MPSYVREIISSEALKRYRVYYIVTKIITNIITRRKGYKIRESVKI